MWQMSQMTSIGCDLTYTTLMTLFDLVYFFKAAKISPQQLATKCEKKLLDIHKKSAIFNAKSEITVWLLARSGQLS